LSDPRVWFEAVVPTGWPVVLDEKVVFEVVVVALRPLSAALRPPSLRASSPDVGAALRPPGGALSRFCSIERTAVPTTPRLSCEDCV